MITHEGDTYCSQSDKVCKGQRTKSKSISFWKTSTSFKIIQYTTLNLSSSWPPPHFHHLHLSEELNLNPGYDPQSQLSFHVIEYHLSRVLVHLLPKKLSSQSLFEKVSVSYTLHLSLFFFHIDPQPQTIVSIISNLLVVFCSVHGVVSSALMAFALLKGRARVKASHPRWGQ